ncbi:hypothetical protein KC19_11G118200 [Ceratodon purpureus]|uniref:Uncharacterized protein n=1 Tax=Ceratodon purpureus TaxID=3225 RepID=A0A8T0GE40_CERPU|nr:hypothetical protein KC19_11G118200 [Ceratodon purpureus]
MFFPTTLMLLFSIAHDLQELNYKLYLQSQPDRGMVLKSGLRLAGFHIGEEEEVSRRSNCSYGRRAQMV